MAEFKNVLHLVAGGGVGGIEILLKNYSRLSAHHNIYIFVWTGGSSADDIRKNGSEVEIIGKENVGIIKTMRHIDRICKKRKIDVIVVHNASPLLRMAGVVMGRINGIKIVQYAHSDAKNMFFYCSRPKAWIVKAINKIAFQHADCIIAISHFVKTSLETEFGIASSKIQIIYNGVPVNEYSVKRNLDSNNNLIYVGRLIKEKGVQIIIRALKQMSKTTCLKIVGDGPYRYELEKLVEQLGLNEKITFFGNRNDVDQLLATSSIFISVPTLEEGLGISVIEAMAAGLICVCSKSGGLVELIQDGRNGFIVNKNDEFQLAVILDSILENIHTDKMNQIIENAKKSSSNYSMKSYTNNMDTIIMQIADRSVCLR